MQLRSRGVMCRKVTAGGMTLPDEGPWVVAAADSE